MSWARAVRNPSEAQEPGVAIREILFPSDLSEQSDRALDHAGLLADRFGAVVTLYHAVEEPHHEYAHWAFAEGLEIWERAEEAARKELVRRGEALAHGHRVVVERGGSAHRALIRFIESSKPDLVVMATHGREGLAHLFLGSVTEKVIRHAHRPVLCVREPEHGMVLPYRRILVPTDLSWNSRKAFPMAALLARAFGAEVVGVHVHAPAGAGAGFPGEWAAPLSEADLAGYLHKEFDGVDLHARVREGVVWERIVELARAEKADLVVMSTRGRHCLADHLVGSNTERVVRHAPCPVLVA